MERKVIISIFIISLSLFIVTQMVHAQEIDITQGGKYTYFGAEFAGNETGEIPAFTGYSEGLKCPDDYKKGMFLPDPYSGEKVLYRIDHTNVDKYKHRLTEGQVVRIKRHKDYYMNVYPTHRNMENPEIFKQATLDTRKTVFVDEDRVLRGFQGGLPFPHPKNGLEAIWNLKKPWAGSDLITHDCVRIVSPSGRIRKSRYTIKLLARDKTRLTNPIPNPTGLAGQSLQFYIYPADRYGEAVLAWSYIDDTKDMDLWQYIPSLRRVRRAPTLGGGFQGDGESTTDDGLGFSGPVGDWEFKLLGKKELYVVWNNYDLWKLNAMDEEECLPMDVNSLHYRYELHRCWMIELIPHADVGHPYSRRIIYLDEDHWYINQSDNWDRRGNLWRTQEVYNQYDYCERHRVVIGSCNFNLESDRYVLQGGCREKDTLTNQLDVGITPDELSVNALRRLGR